MLVRLCRGVFLQHKNSFQFGIEEYFFGKSMKKQQQDFREELDHMASKPIFTINDFKIRNQETMKSLDSKFTSKINEESRKKRRELEDNCKVLFCLFEEELNLNEIPNQKKQLLISQITRVPLQGVKGLFNRYLENKMMHKYIRHIAAKNRELPKNQAELEKGFLDYYQRKGQNRTKKYKTVKKYSRRQKVRYAFGEMRVPNYKKRSLN